ncbi:MAG: PhoU domain-containing protein, partial [Gammaproteobacteria bacterium]
SQITEIAIEMLRTALDAFARVNADNIEEMRRKDAEVDSGFKGAMRQLITFMMEDPRTISRVLNVIWAARALERIGDHARNICEYVIYLVQGKDVRHISLEQIEKELRASREQGG